MPNIFSLGELHLTPLQGIIQLRPNFEYVDRAKDKKASAVKEEGLSHFMRIENKWKPMRNNILLSLILFNGSTVHQPYFNLYQYLLPVHEMWRWARDTIQVSTIIRVFNLTKSKPDQHSCVLKNVWLKNIYDCFMIPGDSQDEEDAKATALSVWCIYGVFNHCNVIT